MELAGGESVQDEEVEGALLEFRRGHLGYLVGLQQATGLVVDGQGVWQPERPPIQRSRLPAIPFEVLQVVVVGPNDVDCSLPESSDPALRPERGRSDQLAV